MSTSRSAPRVRNKRVISASSSGAPSSRTRATKAATSRDATGRSHPRISPSSPIATCVRRFHCFQTWEAPPGGQLCRLCNDLIMPIHRV